MPDVISKASPPRRVHKQPAFAQCEKDLQNAGSQVLVGYGPARSCGTEGSFALRHAVEEWQIQES